MSKKKNKSQATRRALQVVTGVVAGLATDEVLTRVKDKVSKPEKRAEVGIDIARAGVSGALALGGIALAAGVENEFALTAGTAMATVGAQHALADVREGMAEKKAEEAAETGTQGVGSVANLLRLYEDRGTAGTETANGQKVKFSA